jgi:hypothetical protein
VSGVASIRPAPPHDRSGRVMLVTVTIAGMAMLFWLIATLAINAFS